jgi:hypothetical protein
VLELRILNYEIMASEGEITVVIITICKMKEQLELHFKPEFVFTGFQQLQFHDENQKFHSRVGRNWNSHTLLL